MTIHEMKTYSEVIPTGTITMLTGANLSRVALVISRNRAGQNFSVAFQVDAPASTEEMWSLNTTFDGFVFDQGLCPTGPIWVQHAVGSNVTIYWMEG